MVTPIDEKEDVKQVVQEVPINLELINNKLNYIISQLQK